MKHILTIAAALLAGFGGGVVGTLVIHTREHSHQELVVRARGFELVNEAGQTISAWGIDNTQNPVLAFGRNMRPSGGSRAGGPPLRLEDPDTQLATIGLLGDNSPFLTMRGADGRVRVILNLNLDGKPTLLMEDQTGPRLALGLEQSDTPGPQDDDWSLTFRPEVARIGFHAEKHGGQTYVQGGVFVRKDKVKYPE